ncbi:MAG: hypothetical protein EOP50_20150, partial [Sphingobacteriales bacterium]
FGENEGCEGAGQYIPFKTTQAERVSANDPRLSLQERYQTHAGYVEAVRKAAHNLAKRRFLLAEDVQQYVKTAEESIILN